MMAKIFQKKLKGAIPAIAIAMAMVGIFGFGGLAVAQMQTGGIAVSYEQTPLFSNESGDNNIVPGDIISRTVGVENQDSVAHEIAMKFYDTDKGEFGLPGQNLASQFDFEIKKNGNLVYSARLDEAFDKNEIEMNSSLAGGQSETYDFILSFDHSAGNEYQSKTMGFSICLGFAGEDFCLSDESETNRGLMTLASVSGGGISGGTSIIVFGSGVNTFCKDGVAGALLSWNTNLDAVGRGLYAPATGEEVFDYGILPNYGYNTTLWETALAKKHFAVISGLTPGQVYNYRLDMKAGEKRLTTQAFEPFTAPACVLGASDEKDIIEDVMGVSTGVLGEMTDEEIAQFMADLRAENQNSDNEQSGNKIAVATFAPAALAAPVSEAQNSSQNSTTVNYGVIAAFALLVMALVGRFLAKRLPR